MHLIYPAGGIASTRFGLTELPLGARLETPGSGITPPQGWVDTVPWAAFLRASRGAGPVADEIKGEVAAPSTVQHELKRMVEAAFRLMSF